MRKPKLAYRLTRRIVHLFIPGIYCRTTGEIARTYKDYMQTRHWRGVKARYRRKYTYKCVKCGSREKGLHLHHLHYRNIGHEKDRDLVYLCALCHTKEHKRKRRKVAR